MDIFTFILPFILLLSCPSALEATRPTVRVHCQVNTKVNGVPLRFNTPHLTDPLDPSLNVATVVNERWTRPSGRRSTYTRSVLFPTVDDATNARPVLFPTVGDPAISFQVHPDVLGQGMTGSSHIFSILNLLEAKTGERLSEAELFLDLNRYRYPIRKPESAFDDVLYWMLKENTLFIQSARQKYTQQQFRLSSHLLEFSAFKIHQGGLVSSNFQVLKRKGGIRRDHGFAWSDILELNERITRTRMRLLFDDKEWTEEEIHKILLQGGLDKLAWLVAHGSTLSRWDVALEDRRHVRQALASMETRSVQWDDVADVSIKDRMDALLAELKNHPVAISVRYKDLMSVHQSQLEESTVSMTLLGYDEDHGFKVYSSMSPKNLRFFHPEALLPHIQNYFVIE